MTEPTPDIDGMGPPLARPPDEHTALMLWRKVVADPGFDVFEVNGNVVIQAWITPSPAELDLLRRLTEEAD